MKKSELKQLIREEIQKLDEGYLGDHDQLNERIQDFIWEKLWNGNYKAIAKIFEEWLKGLAEEQIETAEANGDEIPPKVKKATNFNVKITIK